MTTTIASLTMNKIQKSYNKKVISYFDLGDNQVEVTISRFPRRVRIYVNDTLVKKTWIFSKSSYHHFRIHRQQAEIIIDSVNSRKGPIFITFNAEGQNIDIDRWETPKRTDPKTKMGTLSSLLIGAACGILILDFLIGVYEGFMA
jgi:hypothetical protein